MNSKTINSKIAQALIAYSFVLVVVVLTTANVSGQNSSLHNPGRQGVLSMKQASLYRQPLPELRTIKMYDKVSVRVEELARVQAEGNMEQRKNLSYNAIIQDWIRLNGLRKAEKTQGSGVDPQIQGTMQQIFRGESELETTERLTFNIAAQVVDLRPNGHLVIEASKEIQVNNEVWLVTLSGSCRQEDIGADNTLLSRDIIDLKIHKKEMGHVRDGYKRGWLHRALDQFHPF